MPIPTDTLLKWVDEIRKEMGGQDRRITRIETVLKVIWALVILVIGAGGVIIALLAHLKSVT
jgi:hypothetical protein